MKLPPLVRSTAPEELREAFTVADALALKALEAGRKLATLTEEARLAPAHDHAATRAALAPGKGVPKSTVATTAKAMDDQRRITDAYRSDQLDAERAAERLARKMAPEWLATVAAALDGASEVVAQDLAELAGDLSILNQLAALYASLTMTPVSGEALPRSIPISPVEGMQTLESEAGRLSRASIEKRCAQFIDAPAVAPATDIHAPDPWRGGKLTHVDDMVGA